MRFRFSPRITLICGALAALMLRASYWQYERYLQKLELIATLEARLNEPPLSTPELLRFASEPAESPVWEKLVHRRVELRGEYDFSREMTLRNRRYGDLPGSYALTPMKIDGSELSLIVSRGFIPLALASKEKRAQFHGSSSARFVGLIKETRPRKFLAPPDPASGPGQPWVDAWLRVDLKQMQRQLPYPILPIFVEIMESPDAKGVEEKIISSAAGREELFYLPGSDQKVRSDKDVPAAAYPLPVYDTVIPPGRHKGYIFEWAALAIGTLLIGLVLQLRREVRAS